MKKRLLPYIFLFTALCATIHAQDSAITWQNTIGGSNWDTLWSLAQTQDGGYVVGGWSASNISGDKTEDSNGSSDFWVLKLNSTGEIVWQNSIGGIGSDNLYSLEETSDGGFILGGKSDSNISGDKTENSRGSSDFWIVKINSEGEVLWDRTIGGSDYDLMWKLVETSDNGYVLGGYSRSDISGEKTENSMGSYDYWVVKVDSSGTILWQNTIGGSGYDELKDLVETSDSGFILGGESESGISGDKTEPSRGFKDYWVVKINSMGQILWDKTIGSQANDDLQSIIETSDGGYLIGGDSSSQASGDKSENSQGANDYWIVKLDASGELVWENTIGGNGIDRCFVVMENTDNQYIVGGYSGSDMGGDKTEVNKGGPDYWLFNLNNNGVIMSQNTIGGTFADILTNIQQTPDGGYFIGGYSYSDISYDKTEDSNGFWDLWVMKLSTLLAVEDERIYPTIQIFPNPLEGLMYYTGNAVISVNIYTLDGKIIASYKNPNGRIDLTQLKSGLYVAEFLSASEKTTKKFVKI